MSDEFEGVDETNSEMVGTVAVHVTRKEVYKAIRNILANEYKLDPIKIKLDLQNNTDELIRTEVLEYLRKGGYSGAQLDTRVRATVDAKLNEFKIILKEVVRELVHKHIHDEVEQVVGVIINDGLVVRLGWPERKVKIERQGVTNCDKAIDLLKDFVSKVKLVDAYSGTPSATWVNLVREFYDKATDTLTILEAK